MKETETGNPISALGVLVVVGTVLLLREAGPLVLPVIIAILLAFTLNPLVELLARIRLPRSLAAILVTLGVTGGVAVGVLQLAGPLEKWVGQVPAAVAALEHHMASVQSRLTSVTEAREQIEELAEQVGGDSERKLEVRIDEDSTARTAQVAGRVTGIFLITMLLLFFLLANGNRLARRIIRLPRRRERQRRILLTILGLRLAVARYLLTITAMNILLAITTTLGLYLLGIPDPWLWGILGGVLNYIPYVGTIVTATAIAIVSLITQTGMLDLVTPIALYLLLNGVEATILTPTVLGDRFSINPLFVVITIVAFGWLWGVGGMFVAVPILVFAREVVLHQGGPAMRYARLLAR